MKAVEWKYSKTYVQLHFRQLESHSSQNYCILLSRIDHLILNGSLKEINDALTISKLMVIGSIIIILDTPSAPRAKALGKSKRNTIVINTIVPILWLSGDIKTKPSPLKDKAIALLEMIPPQKKIILLLRLDES